MKIAHKKWNVAEFIFRCCSWAADMAAENLVHLASQINNFGKFMRSVSLMALSMTVVSVEQRTKSFLPCQHVSNC